MRTIKFRGKRRTNGKWVYGDLLTYSNPIAIGTGNNNPNSCVIHSEDVDGNTVGQFTGLHDKKGKEIYEGDVLKVDFLNYTPAVCYNIDCFMTSKEDKLSYTLCEVYKSCEVIGNIHDNPELLK